MLTQDLLHPYQQKAVTWQCDKPNSAVFMDMGLGKSVVTLTSMVNLLNSGFLMGVLIIAPVRVVRLVWRQEAVKWEHTKHLSFSTMVGTKDQRTRALLRDADVHMINYENMGWLAEMLNTYYISKGKPLPFNGVVFDELSKMKNSTTRRVKSFMKIHNHFHWTTGLTGTPASNGYKDLHGQFLVLDGGQRLGRYKTAFKTKFYRKVGPYKEVPYDDTEGRITQLIGDITLEMSAEDYNPLPDLMMNDIKLDFPPKLRTKYDQMEKDFFLQLENGDSVEVFNAAALTNKLLQFSNGAIYPVAGMPLWEPLHDLKLDALDDIIEEAAGQPVLCSYAYRSDASRIMERFKGIRPINLTDCKSETSLTTAMQRWRDGDCQLMIGHAACVHPRTQVLIERRGWVKIVDVRPHERVFDGVEFVNHDGCSYSGYREVIDLFGITLTPDHKLLIDDEWVEAQNVKSTEEVRRKAIYRWEDENAGSGSMLELWGEADHAPPECDESQQKRKHSLCTLYRRDIPSDDQYPNLENLARTETPSQGSLGQELCGTWDSLMSRMGGLHQLLRRYVRRLLGRIDHRTHRRQWSLLQGQLQMGYEHGTAGQQAQQQMAGIPRRANPFSGTGAQERIQQNDVDHETQSWDDSRRSSGELQELNLREKSECGQPSEKRKAQVYDLVNCGPRHRFLIRNDEGEMFISHNSMGHGIDGLQKNGHTLVWYGLNWSLDLYEQFNARIRRQGQGTPVICHRIMVDGTLDQAQADALDGKATTQSALRAAIKNYMEKKL
jgi:hypothetical protein